MNCRQFDPDLKKPEYLNYITLTQSRHFAIARHSGPRELAESLDISRAKRMSDVVAIIVRNLVRLM